MAEKSPLLPEKLEGRIARLLSALTEPVELTCIPGPGETGQQMALFADHLASLSPLVTLRLAEAGTEAALDEALDVSMLPATGVGSPGQLPRMVFHGIPGGQEINAFLRAVCSAGGRAEALSRRGTERIAAILGPVKLRIFVTLSCGFCSEAVIAAQRIAWEHPGVCAHMIDGRLYPESVRRLGVDRVPMILTEKGTAIRGALSLEALAKRLAQK